MIPTWSTHAREARKHVRFAHRNAVVSLLRYVAHLSATVQTGHHSAPQEPPMTTLAERHEADQDDADRYVLTRVPCAPCQRAHTSELTAEVERLHAVVRDREDTIIERDVTIAQLQEHAEHETERMRVKVNLARLQRDHERQRVEDVADEYQKAGKSWDTTRARLTSERDEARLEVALLKSEVIDFERLFEAKP